MFNSEQDEHQLRISMSATVSNIDEADERLSAFLEHAVPSVDRFAVRILAREGILNAVVHGSGENPEEIVTFSATLQERGLVMVIEDHGPGFDWQSRSGDFDIMGDGGRGLPLMRLYASRVAYNAAGNRVELVRDYQGANADLKAVGEK